MNHKDFYLSLKKILSKDHFDFNDENTRISIKIDKIDTKSNNIKLDDLEEMIISLIGTKIRPFQVQDDYSWKIK